MLACLWTEGHLYRFSNLQGIFGRVVSEIIGIGQASLVEIYREQVLRKASLGCSDLPCRS